MKLSYRRRVVFRASDVRQRAQNKTTQKVGFGAQEGFVVTGADLPGVVVPQLLVQAVGVSLLSLDLGDDIKHV